MMRSRAYALDGATKAESLKHVFAPETHSGDPLSRDARGGEWTLHHALGNDLGLADQIPADHAVYIRAFFHATAARKVMLGVPTTGAVRSWVNGRLLHDFAEVEPFRPHGHKTQVHLDADFQAGFNEVLLKLVRPAAAKSFESHLILVDPAEMDAGIVDLNWTQLPWD